MAKKILKNILKNETVFCVSLLLAVLLHSAEPSGLRCVSERTLCGT